MWTPCLHMSSRCGFGSGSWLACVVHHTNKAGTRLSLWMALHQQWMVQMPWDASWGLPSGVVWFEVSLAALGSQWRLAAGHAQQHSDVVICSSQAVLDMAQLHIWKGQRLTRRHGVQSQDDAMQNYTEA